MEANLDRNVRRLVMALLMVGLLVSPARGSIAPAMNLLPDSVVQLTLISLILAVI